MLWSASVVNGYAIEANDGRLGTVSGSLFEHASWMIRGPVVDTGIGYSAESPAPSLRLGRSEAGRR